MRVVVLICGTLTSLCSGTLAAEREIVVRDSQQLTSAVHSAEPGATIWIESGDYSGGLWFEGVKGRENSPIVIAGRDVDKPPVFAGRNEGLHFSGCQHLEVRNLHVVGPSDNGINVDEGGVGQPPSRRIVLENLTIENVGPRGNHDALKLSGLDDFVVCNCTFRGWGGSAIDLVGCHRGVVVGCTFVGLPEFSQANGVQIKGGSTDVTVRQSSFENAGERAINLGGMTGPQFFRPHGVDYEAKDVVVAGNRFVGSMAAIAFVTAQDAHVHHNTFLFPEKWVLRILQESTGPPFDECQRGIFENNLVVFDRRVQVFVNVGPQTKPETFRFKSNAWHSVDGHRKPILPVPEEAGIDQFEITIHDPKTQSVTVSSDDPRLENIGADAYQE